MPIIQGGSVELRTEVVPATGQIVLPNGNFFFMLTATAAVTVRFQRGGTTFGATGVSAGFLQRCVEDWERLTLTAAAGTSITYIVGYSYTDRDETDIRTQIAVIGGTVSVAVSPSSTLTDTPDTAQATATETVIAADLTRRRITIGVRSDGNEPVRVSQAGGAGRGIEISPGTYAEFDTTAALTVRNDNTFGSGLGTTWYALREG